MAFRPTSKQAQTIGPRSGTAPGSSPARLAEPVAFLILLMFAGHAAYRFRQDSFCSNNFTPTVKQLVDRILTRD